LLCGHERRVYGDSAYACQKDLIHRQALKARYFTNYRTRKAGGEVNKVKRSKNRKKSKIRARVKHVFAMIKRLWSFTKMRYRGLVKSVGCAFIALAWVNIYCLEIV